MAWEQSPLENKWTLMRMMLHPILNLSNQDIQVNSMYQICWLKTAFLKLWGTPHQLGVDT